MAEGGSYCSADLWCAKCVDASNTGKRLEGDGRMLPQVETAQPVVRSAVMLHLTRPKGVTCNGLPDDEGWKACAVCAEAGVLKGDFSAEILQRTQPKLLHLIEIDLSR